MHKRKNINSIFRDNGKLSSVKPFDSVAPVEKKKHRTLSNSAPAGVLTFSFHTNSLIEISGQLDGEI